MSETHKYVTTDRAGFTVAARRIPGADRAVLDADGRPLFDDDGKPKMVFAPKVGFELQLTAAEAEYELQQGTIMPRVEVGAVKAEEPAKAADEKDAAAASGATKTDESGKAADKKPKGRADSDAPPSNAA